MSGIATVRLKRTCALQHYWTMAFERVIAVWMDLVLVSMALLPWLMQSKVKRAADEALTLAAETEAEPAVQPHRAPEF